MYNLINIFCTYKEMEKAMSIQPQRSRGRPHGSTKSVHRVRRDYRFSQETLGHITHGRELRSEELDETAFVEQAIAHYTAFLAGEAQVNQEVARLQAQVRDLEHDLDRTQQALRLAEARMKQPSQPVSPVRATAHKPLYQILIRHDPGACPMLPDGYNFLYVQENEQRCPVHQVFAVACPIDRARRRIEVLKQVPGLSRIWLTKNGYSTPQDDWQRKGSGWQRTN
jgi:hypothetical protein